MVTLLPDVSGKDRDAFVTWARTRGAREMGYDPRLVRTESASDVAAGGADQEAVDPSVGQAIVHHPEPAPHQNENAGVNVCGYLRNETGLGAVARGYVRALRSLPVPVALKDLSDLSPNRSEDPTLTAFDTDHPYGINLVCVNADQHFVVMSHVGEEFFRNRYNIGVWFWELSRFPEEWRDRFKYYHEIWAASSFIARTLATVAPIPIVHVPPVLTMPSKGCRDRGRRRLRVSAGELVYLFIFDFASYVERKNPFALIDAFRQAFRPSDPVRLVIKCVNHHLKPDAFAAMKSRAQGWPISIYSGYWSLEEMQDLMAACDAYVSLHRSKVWGLPSPRQWLSESPLSRLTGLATRTL